MREIAEHIIHALNDGTDSVLVTVMKHRGSAPRHAGSQMLVDGSGLACGTIGGGAIEGHAIAEAQAMLGERHGQERADALTRKLITGRRMWNAVHILNAQHPPPLQQF